MLLSARRRVAVAIAAIVGVIVVLASFAVSSGSRSALPAQVIRDHPAVSVHTYSTGDGQEVIAFWNEARRTASAPGSQPWIAYVHGGGWVAGRPGEQAVVDFCDRMVSLGITCFSLGYTLVPHARWPVQDRQVSDELAWVREQGDAFHLDQRTGFVGGHSAGALMAGTAGLADGRLAGILSLAGAVNVPYLIDTSKRPHLRRYGRVLLGGAAPDSELGRSASVIGHVTPSTPRVPYLIAAEVHDPVIDCSTSTMLAAQLRADGFPVTLYRVPGHSHGVDIEGPGVELIDRWLINRIAAVRAEQRDTSGITRTLQSVS